MIVVDIGANETKAGFAGEDTPHSVFPTLIGKIKSYDPAIDGMGKDFLVGADAKSSTDITGLHCPMKNGIFEGKDDFEKLFKHIFENELHLDAERHPIVLSEPINNPVSARQLYAEILFESFHCPSVYYGTTPQLAMYTSNKTTGVVLDIGESFAQVASIFEWTQIPQSLQRSPLGGASINRFIQNSLKGTSYHFQNQAGFEIARDIKEKHCFIARDFRLAEQQEEGKFVDYSLSPDYSIQIGAERYTCPELLFNPSLQNIQCDNIAQMVYESIMRCDTGLRSELFSNIVVCGGTTLFQGFADRLSIELKKLAPEENINFVFGPKREYSAWIGGSVLGSMALFHQMVVTLDEYRESGITAIQNRFY